MKQNDERKIDIISGIDDTYLEKATNTRIFLFSKMKKKNSRAFIPWVAMAASLVLVVGAVLAILPHLDPNSPPVETTPPSVETGGMIPSNKQIPIYQGMTVSSTNPQAGEDTPTVAITPNVTPISLRSGITPRISLLTETKPTPPKPTPPHEKHTEAMTEAVTQAPTHDFDANAEVYYANANEDFYITVHLSNPDNFEILSFTLNGKKYSSYMFEQGSDMENLILKCNVGDAEGIVEYTIDAIKYVDGEDLKDVRMEGDRTIEIRVYPENQPTVAVDDVAFDHISLTMTPTITDELDLIADSEGELLVKLHHGDTLVEEKSFVSGDVLHFTDLAPETAYKYTIVAVYDAIDGQGKVAHVLYEETITTNPVISFTDVSIEGLTATFTINGADTMTALDLYEGDTLYRELDIDTRKVERLPIDKEVSLVATYTVGDKIFQSFYTLPMIKESEGLYIVDGFIVNIGTCTDTVLYLNHPIKEYAFKETVGNTFINEIYCGEGVTNIGEQAFEDCLALEKFVFSQTISQIKAQVFGGCKSLTDIVIPDHITSIGDSAFAGCSSLTSITIPDGVTSIGQNTFSGCSSLMNITIPSNVTIISEFTFYGCSSLTGITIPDSVTSIGTDAFANCSSLTSITIPNSVTSIKEMTFFNCDSLTDVYFTGSTEQWEQIIIGHGGNDTLEAATIHYNYVPQSVPKSKT